MKQNYILIIVLHRYCSFIISSIMKIVYNARIKVYPSSANFIQYCRR